VGGKAKAEYFLAASDLPHGKPDQILARLGLDAVGVQAAVRRVMGA